MKKETKKEIQNKLLTEEQSSVVKQTIVRSMREAYVNRGIMPDAGFEQAASNIADNIIKDSQKVLMESNVYKKIIDSTKPLKVTKVKKHARK